MAEYTKEQIAAAARLVPGIFEHRDHLMIEYPLGTARPWQPWADTEAGRSDALVLLAAVMKWYDKADIHERETVATVFEALAEAMTTGNVQQIQQATMAAAMAKGEA